jgi:hypothetical protein
MPLYAPNHVAATMLLTATLTGLPSASAGPARCLATSGLAVPTVVELYTSEGCSSCPPADRWLSSLQGQPGIVSLAFHVDYWDLLGWKDRFADPAYTLRQHEVSARSGARFVYTPQVLVDGSAYRAWPAMLRVPNQPATVQVTLTQEGDAYVARIVRGPGAPMRLEAFWAVTEDSQVSQVSAGENSGASLRHDAVVRDYLAVPSVGDTPLRFVPRVATGRSAARRVLLVVTEPASGRPVQAVGC